MCVVHLHASRRYVPTAQGFLFLTLGLGAVLAVQKPPVRSQLMRREPGHRKTEHPGHGDQLPASAAVSQKQIPIQSTGIAVQLAVTTDQHMPGHLEVGASGSIARAATNGSSGIPDKVDKVSRKVVVAAAAPTGKATKASVLVDSASAGAPGVQSSREKKSHAAILLDAQPGAVVTGVAVAAAPPVVTPVAVAATPVATAVAIAAAAKEGASEGNTLGNVSLASIDQAPAAPAAAAAAPAEAATVAPAAAPGSTDTAGVAPAATAQKSGGGGILFFIILLLVAVLIVGGAFMAWRWKQARGRLPARSADQHRGPQQPKKSSQDSQFWKSAQNRQSYRKSLIETPGAGSSEEGISAPEQVAPKGAATAAASASSYRDRRQQQPQEVSTSGGDSNAAAAQGKRDVQAPVNARAAGTRRTGKPPPTSNDVSDDIAV